MSASFYTCPQSHRSDTADFCSVCGAEIAGAPAGPAAPTSSAACPQCATVAESAGQVFCEVCGYNFRTGGSGVPPAPIAAPAVVPISAPSAAPPAPAAPAEQVRWELTVAVDATLYGAPNPDAPVGAPVQTFTLFDNESLLGRGGTDVRVQIPVRGDTGISRRHVLLIRRPDGTLVVRDVGSANGTQLNGKELVAGVETPVADGAVIAVGAWTRVTVHRVRR
jgi:hypothetical protein